MSTRKGGLRSAVRTAIRWVYAFACVIWLGALAFAGYRIYQMRTLTALEAEVLLSGVDSYVAPTYEADSDGFTTQSGAEVHVPVVRVRYSFEGNVYTIDARHDTGGLKWVQDRIALGWAPGTRIRIHVDPRHPDQPIPGLGFNLATFQGSLVLLFAGAVFALCGHGLARAALFASDTFERAAFAKVPAPPSLREDDDALPVPEGSARFVAGAACCVAAPLFDPLGYILTLLGVFLLCGARSVSAAARLVACAILLPPRIAPLLLSALAGPGELSFVLEPHPASLSASSWGWYGLLWAACACLLLLFSEKGNAFLAATGLRTPAVPGTVYERTPGLVVIPALFVLGWATYALLDLKNAFEWVEARDGKPLTLRHAVRGAAATFTPQTLASIGGREEIANGRSLYHVRVALEDGKTFHMTTAAPTAFSEIKKLAATVEVPPGRIRLKTASGTEWANGAFALKSVAGWYHAANGDFVELRLDERGRLAGAQSISSGAGERITRSLRAVKVSEEGDLEFQTGRFSGASGRFEPEGLVLNGMSFKKAGK